MKRTVICLAWLAVAVLALMLRLQDLTESPIQSNEAIGAKLLGERLEGKDTGLDPAPSHGPWLLQSTRPLAIIRGEHDWSSLSLKTLRLNTVLAGWLLCLTPLLWVRLTGHAGALVGAAFLGSSPLLIHYSRTYIDESWFALFGMIALAGLYKFLRSPNQGNALLTGLSIGLMFSTKATFAISVLAWALASAFLLWKPARNIGRPSPRDYLRAGIPMGLWALLISAFFYTDAFRHPAGYIDAWTQVFAHGTTPALAHPSADYLQNLIWPKQRLGLWWSEGLLAIFALAAIGSSFRRNTRADLPRFLALSILVHVLIYSCLSDKTPWLMLLPWAQVCLLAGIAFQNWAFTAPTKKVVLRLLLIVTLGWQTKQSLDATGRFANDARNPYAYLPTDKSIQTLPLWLEEVSAGHTLKPFAVVGSAYWPLPWYLRGLDEVTYSPTMRAEFSEYAIVLVMPENLAEANRQLAESHQARPRGLRENVSLTVYLRKDRLQK